MVNPVSSSKEQVEEAEVPDDAPPVKKRAISKELTTEDTIQIDRKSAWISARVTPKAGQNK